MPAAIRDLLILSTISGIGPNRLRALVSHFGEMRTISRASARDLCAVEGIERKTAHAITQFFRTSGPGTSARFADDQLSRLNKVNGTAVTFWDSTYPENLRKIYDPPPYLFVRGGMTGQDRYAIAIVGTRTPTAYGVQLAERFAGKLSDLGIPVVSGLARGIDTVAHHATLLAGGITYGVIGSGIDVMYPPENRSLMERMLDAGAVISEFPMGAKPDAGNFPRRNRIISGITLGTIVIETGTNGGAMITASTALDQNRELFAIPAPVNDRKPSGCNLLIREGKAKLTETIDDVLVELGPRLKRILHDIPGKRPLPPPDLSLFEQKLFDVLGEDPVHIDLLAERAGLSISDALVHLLSLEFKGIIRQQRGKMFVRT